jgi:hypothetical protein
MLPKPFALAALLVASCGAQAASDADLAAIRGQIDEMKKSYEQRIASLEQRLVQAEASAKPVAAAPVNAAPVAAASTAGKSASGFNPEVSLILQGAYRDMKNVPNRQISGFVSVPDSEAPKRGFSVDGTELVLGASIDPYWRGRAIISLHGSEVEVEEAWFQSLAIGHGIGVKGGRIRSGIGYLNEQHPHAWDFSDAPLMYQAMFGSHGGYAQDGVQLKWLAPTPVFLEFGAEFGRGANFPGTDKDKNGTGSGALFAHIGGDLGVANNWRAGVSYLSTSATDREAKINDINGTQADTKFSGDSATWLADFVWKWSPNGNPKYQNFKFQTEYFSREEKGSLKDEGTSVTSSYRTRQNGWYAQGVYQFTSNWRAGLRYDQLDSGSRDFGDNSSNLVAQSYRPKRASAMVDYSWSEFSRMRLQFAQDKSMAGITDNQLTLQYIMSLGAHGAHKF